MEIAASRAYGVWRSMLRVIMDNHDSLNSRNLIPERLEPLIKELHGKLHDCECRHAACVECVTARRVLLWVWEKMDEGF
jgi:hypothetical protein